MPALSTQALRPLTSEPRSVAIFCDVDGTLAPIVERPEHSRVPEETRRLLGRLGRAYGSVACVSGRAAMEVRRLVGLDEIAYVGSHGAEILDAGAGEPELIESFATWEDAVGDFARERAEGQDALRLGLRLEDKGPIKAFHWRGTPDEAAAQALLESVAADAKRAGLAIHWGRKVLEIRPPVPVDKGEGLRALLERRPASTALYAGDDVTDLDAFDALDSLVASGGLTAAVKVGIRSDEGPAGIVDRADLAVDGVEGFAEVLAVLADALR